MKDELLDCFVMTTVILFGILMLLAFGCEVGESRIEGKWKRWSLDNGHAYYDSQTGMFTLEPPLEGE